MLFNLFKNLKEYKDLTASEFEEAIKDKTGILLDVRSASEFKSERIKGSKNIDVMGSDFREAIKNFSKEKNYYVYCRSGGRSGTACRLMAKEGFKNLFNLRGGIMGWHGETIN
jgi:rhodanese-related sulfurtransferase